MIIQWTKSELVVLPITLVVMIVITIFLSWLLRDKSERVRNIPQTVIAAIILILEVIKQSLSISSGYSLWNIPLHFCSFFLVWYPLAQFTRGKAQLAFKSIAFVWGFLLFALFYFNPGSIIGGACDNVFESFGTAHTFIFHHLAILYFMLSVGLKTYRPQYKHIWYALACLVGYACIAIPCAYLLDVNFCNILYNNIPILENLRVHTNQVLYDFVLFSLGAVGTILIICVCTAIANWLDKMKQKNMNKHQSN